MEMKIQGAVFWVVTLCSDVVTIRKSLLPPSSLKRKTLWSSKMLVSYITEWHHNPEHHHMKIGTCLNFSKRGCHTKNKVPHNTEYKFCYIL